MVYLTQVSAVLYSAQVSPENIALVLTLGSLAQWLVWDNTKSALALGITCALIAPLTEIFIMAYLEWWHYPLPDLIFFQADNEFTPLAVGIPLWVPLCYFFYTPAVGNLAEWLKKDVCVVPTKSDKFQ